MPEGAAKRGQDSDERTFPANPSRLERPFCSPAGVLALQPRGQLPGLQLWSNRRSLENSSAGLLNIIDTDRHPPSMAAARPLIGIPADRRMLGLHPFHVVGNKYD